MTEMEELDAKIAEAKKVLATLYAKKKELKAAEKASRPRKPSSEERQEQIYALAQNGLTLHEIAVQIGLTYGTTRLYLWHQLFNMSCEEMPEAPYEMRLEKMKEINAKLPHGLTRRNFFL